jgi:WD40 repeat protein
MQTGSGDICRRIGVAALLLAGLGPRVTPAQDVTPAWPCRTIQLPPRTARDKPPVITAISLQPASHLLALAGDDHVIYVWDVETGREVRRLEGHTDWVHAVAFSPDGKVLASAGHDRQVIFWDAATGSQRCVLSGPSGAVTKLAWSHDGQRLAATGFENELRIYDAARQRLLKEIDGPGIDLRALAFSHDDRLIAVGGRSGVIRVFQTGDFRQLHEYPAHRQRIRDLLFSADDQQIVSVGEDQRIHVRSLGSSHGTDLPSRPAKLLSLAFVGPQQLAVGGSDNLIRIWDLSTGSEIGHLTGHEGSVAALVADRNMLISGGFDTTVRIWTIEDRVAGHPQRTREVK